MRYLMAMLGVLAMLVALSGPVAALAVKAPCHGASMTDIAKAAKDCTEPCLAAGNCQSQCGSTVPFVRAVLSDLASPLFTMRVRVAEGKYLPGTDTPVDGPPPRV